jgi:hypothetical protein
MKNEITSDKIREAIALRAAQRELTAYAIAKQLEGVPSEESIKRYLTGRCSLSTKYVSRICDVLGLEIRPASSKRA